ncbi:FMN-binding glutamate synthase family protein [Sporosalibacterium faouarense]|uniref:FMN-binding glutamate synthase family protein n=1 Tax=Sporosalibacterium faouarense TaxID=516123 RepID=UPI00192B0070|nr:FMN-binding glutamate synthase family protein [Sporosalibacterium faouarense]
MKKLTDVYNIDKLLLDEIYNRASNSKPLYEHLGSTKPWPDFDQFKFLSNQLHEFMSMEHTNIKTKTTIGSQAKRPMEIDIPLMITGMTYGVISGASKIALAKAAALVGTSSNSDEGGFQLEEREIAPKYVVQYNRGNYCNEENHLKLADMIELKWVQGANPGTLDFKKASEITEELSILRGLDPGEDSYMPPHHRNISSHKNLKKTVEWLKEITEGVSISIKICGSRIKEDIDVAIYASADVIVMDGAQGGTGGSLLLIENDFGLPTMYSTSIAAEYLKKKEMEDKVSLIIAGGIRTPGDIMKALALGVDAIYSCKLFLLAITLPMSRDEVFINKPLQLIHYNVPENSLFDTDKGSNSLANYMKACMEEKKMGCGLLSIDDVHKLNKNHMYSLSEQVSKATGVKYVTEI